MKCPSCGADNAPTDVQCNHCGSHLTVTTRSERAAVFSRIKTSKAYADRNSAERIASLPRVSELHKVLSHVALAIFIGLSAMMALAMLGVAGLIRFQGRGIGTVFSLAPLLMALLPIGFVVLGVFLYRNLGSKFKSLESGPVDAEAVIVVGKRTHISGGGSNRSASTSYFVTVEGEDGERSECQVWDGALYGRLAADDAGILFKRGGYGLDFDRVSN